MKKLLKITALLFTLMLIVTSCGRSPVDDAKTVAKVLDIDKNAVYKAEEMKDFSGAVKMAEEQAVVLKNVIDVINYYLENEDGYDDFKEALEKIKPSLARDILGDNYGDFKKRMKRKNRGLERLEDEYYEWKEYKERKAN